jgi:hypothetical protein
VQGKVIPERHPGTYSSLPGGSSTHPSLDVWLWPILLQKDFAHPSAQD